MCSSFVHNQQKLEANLSRQMAKQIEHIHITDWALNAHEDMDQP